MAPYQFPPPFSTSITRVFVRWMHLVLHNLVGHQPHCLVTCWLTSNKHESRISQTNKVTGSVKAAIYTAWRSKSLWEMKCSPSSAPAYFIWQRCWPTITLTGPDINHSRSHYYSKSCPVRSRQSEYKQGRQYRLGIFTRKEFPQNITLFSHSLLLSITWLHTVTSFLKGRARNC